MCERRFTPDMSRNEVRMTEVERRRVALFHGSPILPTLNLRAKSRMGMVYDASKSANRRSVICEKTPCLSFDTK